MANRMIKKATNPSEYITNTAASIPGNLRARKILKMMAKEQIKMVSRTSCHAFGTYELFATTAKP